jgi:hypothetical protein
MPQPQPAAEESQSKATGAAKLFVVPYEGPKQPNVVRIHVKSSGPAVLKFPVSNAR